MNHQNQPPTGEQPQYVQPPQQSYYGDDKNNMPQQQMHQQQPQPATAYAHASILPSKFQFGLFDCFSPLGTCCLSCWCPCVLFGKTYARERGEKDPSGMNGMCVAHCCLLYCGISPFLQCFQRGNMQDKYGMEGNLCINFLTAYCCGCCQLVQEEKESIIRNTGMDPETKQPYVPPTGMSYP